MVLEWRNNFVDFMVATTDSFPSNNANFTFFTNKFEFS